LKERESALGFVGVLLVSKYLKADPFRPVSLSSVKLEFYYERNNEIFTLERFE